MQQRHADRRQYFEEQARTTARYVIPFIETQLAVGAGLRVLEVGCGEGGNLLPFVSIGCECTGIDLNGRQIARAKEFYADTPRGGQVVFYHQDIYTADANLLGQFDLIMLRDVIEHIVDQQRFMAFIHKFLRPDGRLFLGFPPWYMPFGGHQQICENRWLSKLPWFHLLPMPLYKVVLRLGGENEATLQELEDIKQTGISIERLRRESEQAGWTIEKETLYLINPNYETKFGLSPKELPAALGILPGIRNFYTTCAYLLLSHKQVGGLVAEQV